MMKFYSLDECSNRDLVLEKLRVLEDDRKIEFDVISDIIKIKDIGLDINDSKNLYILFNEYNIIEDKDYSDLEEFFDSTDHDFDDEDMDGEEDNNYRRRDYDDEDED